MSLDWFLRHRYALMLLALVLVYVIHPVLREFEFGQWAYDVLLTLVYLAAFPVLFKRRSYRVVAVLLGVPTIVAHWTGYVVSGLPPEPLTRLLHGFSALFLGFTVAAILQAIHEAEAVSADSLAGAFSGYLLTGAVFGHIYSILESVSPGSFHVPAELATELATAGQRRFVLTYFSFITLTTVGYGEIWPATATARELSCMEAVTGQFYVAVVMAELIGLKVSRSANARQPGPE